ncbi:MAG: rhamnogalacturonan lyase [Prevotellaceae bacterium]|nr:rhamnogalacturonan lyase [Prevotellaceae bacterium]
MKTNLLLALSCLCIQGMAQTNYKLSEMQMQPLDRGVVAVRRSQTETVVQWRYLSSDAPDASFLIYKNGRRVACVPARQATMWVDTQSDDGKATYEVCLQGGKGKAARGKWTVPQHAPLGYVEIPLQTPADQVGADGQAVHYNANDASVADLDGDGQMEIVLKWDPSNSKDNSQSGITNNTLVDAYKLDGTLLWRIDLGRNVRSGAHYTQPMVYDLDGDGRAEVVMKTGDGTIDGKGKVIGDPGADYRVVMGIKNNNEYNSPSHPKEEFRKDGRGQRGGFIRGAKEFLTVFDGRTGKAVHTVPYVPRQGRSEDWGDNYSNRSERYLACVAYLDGVHPSVVMCRGYYTRTVLAAWDFNGRELKQRWVFDTDQVGEHYAGQGNHNLRVGDVDGDGRDEIIYGSMAVNDDGTGLYTTGMGHGDALHLTSFLPLNDALQVWDCHENRRDGSSFREASTGKILFQLPSRDDVGRCMAADVLEDSPGLEMWSSASGGIRNFRGEMVDSLARLPINMAVWWDGDLLREMLDHEKVQKYNPTTHRCDVLLEMDGCSFNNGTKSNPCLQGDLLGDWREEVLVRTADNRHLRLYVTPHETPYRFHTFLHDPVYRLSITTQNVAYNQPTQVGFYFGAELRGSGRLFRGWQF